MMTAGVYNTRSMMRHQVMESAPDEDEKETIMQRFSKYKCISKEFTVEVILKLGRVEALKESDGEYFGQVIQRMKHGSGRSPSRRHQAVR